MSRKYQEIMADNERNNRENKAKKQNNLTLQLFKLQMNSTLSLQM